MFDRRPLLAERAIATVENPALLHRTAPRPYRLIGQKLQPLASVVHEVAPHLVRGIGHVGNQQQLGGFQTVGGDHKVLGGEPHVVAL